MNNVRYHLYTGSRPHRFEINVSDCDPSDAEGRFSFVGIYKVKPGGTFSQTSFLSVDEMVRNEDDGRTVVASEVLDQRWRRVIIY